MNTLLSKAAVGALVALALACVSQTLRASEPCECPGGTLLLGDLDGDGCVTSDDETLFSAAYGSCQGDEAYRPCADMDQSGCINFIDYNLFLAAKGNCCSTPTPTATLTPTATATATGTSTSSPTSTRTATPTSTRTLTPTPTWTPTCTESPTLTATCTPTATVTPTFSPSATSPPTQPGRIVGRVTFRGRTEHRDYVKISLKDVATGLITTCELLTDAAGNYTISPMPAGTYHVLCQRPTNLSRLATPVLVPSGGTVTVDFLDLCDGDFNCDGKVGPLDIPGFSGCYNSSGDTMP